MWPEGLVHYVQDHFVRLPSEVEQHVLKAMARYEDTSHRDLDWWVSVTRADHR